MGRGRRLNHPRSAEPQRRCVGCRTSRPAREMLRIAAVRGEPVLDGRRVLPGRGAWICKVQRCGEVASRARGVSRALKGKATEPSSAMLQRWITAALPLTPGPANK